MLEDLQVLSSGIHMPAEIEAIVFGAFIILAIMVCVFIAARIKWYISIAAIILFVAAVLVICLDWRILPRYQEYTAVLTDGMDLKSLSEYFDTFDIRDGIITFLSKTRVY